MKRIWWIFAVAVLSLGLAGCGSQATSNPGVDISGNWNAFVTQAGQSSPSYAFGMKFTKDTSVVTGSEIAFTGGSQPNTGCINYGSLTASGNVSGGSNVTITLTDSTTNSSFTINMTPNSGVTQMQGDFNAVFGANGSNAACAGESGTVLFTKQ
ncbi:MAG TPA: hypothetical protein VGL89_08305 [Candidatus Koribacter sp.]|jgi:hypothetical protein